MEFMGYIMETSESQFITTKALSQSQQQLSINISRSDPSDFIWIETTLNQIAYNQKRWML